MKFYDNHFAIMQLPGWCLFQVLVMITLHEDYNQPTSGMLFSSIFKSVLVSWHLGDWIKWYGDVKWHVLSPCFVKKWWDVVGQNRCQPRDFGMSQWQQLSLLENRWLACKLWPYMEVSRTGGTPKSSILIGFSNVNQPFLIPPFMETSISSWATWG